MYKFYFKFTMSKYSAWSLILISDIGENLKIYFCNFLDKIKVLVTQLCPERVLTLCKPMDCSPPGSSVYGILQARILEWVVIPFSRGMFLSQGLNTSLLHELQADFFTFWDTREVSGYFLYNFKKVSITINSTTIEKLSTRKFLNTKP